MGIGTVDAQIVEAPITTAKVETALTAALTATSAASGAVSITAFDVGSSLYGSNILITAIENKNL